MCVCVCVTCVSVCVCMCLFIITWVDRTPKFCHFDDIVLNLCIHS